jgi:hypothetical protein
MAFEINEWEIWHTYTTYLDSSPLNLSKCAQSLVESGVALCAVLSNGRTYWRSHGDVMFGQTALDLSTGGYKCVFTLAPDEESHSIPEGFALEACGEAAYFLLGERKVLGESAALSVDYVRAYLGKIVLKSTDADGSASILNLYPVLIIYETGVLILEFRMIGPNTPISLDDFINGGVNLFMNSFYQVEVNPGLARNATKAYHRSSKLNFLQRSRMIWLQTMHDLAVRQRTRRENDESFSFDMTPWSGQNDNLQSIAITIFHTCSFLVNGPRNGLIFLFFGQPMPPDLGEFWSGRPHIHLIRFKGQCETATENDVIHGATFARILARSLIETKSNKLHLPKDARLFEDYSAYVTSASSLWVWSKKGLKDQAPYSDSNHGNLIYERQAIMELLEYGYMLHRALYHQVEQLSSTNRVVAARKEVLRLRLRMREASHSGEIRDLLENGWKELGLPALTSEIDSVLSLREAEMRSQDTLRATRVGWGIAVVFGLMTVPALADQVILPAWNFLHIYLIADPLKARLIADALSVTFILLVLMLTLAVFTRNGKS